MVNKLSFVKQRLVTDDMTRHGMIMVTFAILAGFFMYLYQLSMGTLLGSQQYGILFSFTSLLTIIMVFSQAISTTMAKFTSKLRAEDRLGGVNYLWHFSLKRSFLISMGVFVLLAGLSLLAIFAITMFTNVDVGLAKHYR